MSQAKKGAEHLKAGEKALKTSLFKWKPDYDNAANDFDQAGKCFRVAKDVDRCIDAYRRAAAAHAGAQNIFHAASSLEKACDAAKDAKKLDVAFDLMKESLEYFKRSGDFVSAAVAIEKAAKLAEKNGAMSDAMDTYEEAFDMFMQETQRRQCKTSITKGINLAFKAKDRERAERMLEKYAKLLQELEQTGALNHIFATHVLILLVVGDVAAASAKFDQFTEGSTGFVNSDAFPGLAAIFDAIDEQDQMKLDKAVKDPVLSMLENEVVTAMRGLRIERLPAVSTRREAVSPKDPLHQPSAAPAEDETPSDPWGVDESTATASAAKPQVEAELQPSASADETTPADAGTNGDSQVPALESQDPSEDEQEPEETATSAADAEGDEEPPHTADFGDNSHQQKQEDVAEQPQHDDAVAEPDQPAEAEGDDDPEGLL